VHITTDRDWDMGLLYVGFLRQNFFGFVAELPNLIFWERLVSHKEIDLTLEGIDVGHGENKG
jgi:hypothetical protein